jgi:hypothetical protein
MLNLQTFVILAGIAQMALALGSLTIPQILNWRDKLVQTNTLIRRIFWGYAAYIFTINLSFGLLSAFNSGELTNGSHLGTIITGFIALYWISRLLIQFFCFDRADFPKGKWNWFGEMVLVGTFVFLSFVYIWAFISNYLIK